MKIKRSALKFNNCISYTAVSRMDEWHLKARELRNAIIKSGLYGTGPVIYQVSHFNETVLEAEYTFYIPVNAPVNFNEDSPYRFMESLSFTDGLVLRHADLDESVEESYQILLACAEDSQFALKEPFFNIYLDVYGDGIIDIYAPIVTEEQHD